jgi:hypothetical protein
MNFSLCAVKWGGNRRSDSLASKRTKKKRIVVGFECERIDGWLYVRGHA